MAAPRISEFKTTLSGERKRFDCELLEHRGDEVVVVYRMPKDTRLEDLLLPRGTLSLGYFWERRAYNLYHWVDDAGATLALYFNICDNTRISGERIDWRDLAVDILLTPGPRCRVLDEDELPDDLDPRLRDYIDRTRDRLCADAERLLREFDARSRALLRGN